LIFPSPFEHHQADASAHIPEDFQVSLSEDQRLTIGV